MPKREHVHRHRAERDAPRDGLERHEGIDAVERERRDDRPQGAKARALELADIAGDAPGRQAGEFGQRRNQQARIAAEQSAQHKPGGELALFAQMPHEGAGAIEIVGRIGGQKDGRLLARLAGGAFGALGRKPVARDDKAGEGVGGGVHQFGAQSQG